MTRKRQGISPEDVDRMDRELDAHLAHQTTCCTMLGHALRLVWKLHAEGTLSEGQCCKALGIERVEFRIICDEFANESVAASSKRSGKATFSWSAQHEPA